MQHDEYDLAGAFERIEYELMSSMIRNMDRHRAEETEEGYNWSMWQAEQLKALEKYKKNNQKKYQKQFKSINAQIEEVIRQARQKGNMQQEIRILQAIKKGWKVHGKNKTPAHQAMTAEFFKLNDRKLEALIKATMEDMEKAETAVLRKANDDYRKAIFNAQVYANTGAGTYEKAVDMATKDMLSRGLNCVMYANGARHTLADYADMAIRTASKRAYLQGEGEKRQEWGVTTVIMAKRGNPCPKCLPFVGKVLIDDVWSGGRSDGVDPETGKKYPLMSYAISQGLYHPRCKDSHTTYFPGISTADDTWTNEELENIGLHSQQEARQQYAKRQEEKYGRLAEYSLDEENQKMYAGKRAQWSNDIAKNQKNDIIESDLGAFKYKLRNDKDISKEYYNGLKEKFLHGSTAAKHIFSKYASGETIETSAFEGIAHFNTETKKISMHYSADLNNSRGVGVTWFHEHGHLIDDALGIISDDQHFKELLEQDVFQYRMVYGKEHNLKTYDKIDRSISKDLQNMRKHSAVSDLLDGLTKGNIKGCAGHESDYWNNPGNITSEAFAHMFEAQFDEVRYFEIKKYFPESLEYFEKKLKGVAK